MLSFDYIKEQFLSLNIPLNMHYLERYIKFILIIPETSMELYGEYHHILPSSLFKEFKSRKLCNWNQKRINARAHYLCHWMLWKSLPDNYKMTEAFSYMSVISKDFHDRIHKINSRISSKARKEANYLKSIMMKEKFKDKSKHPRTGKKLNKEQVSRLSKSHMGNKASEETKAKMSLSRKGIIYELVTCPFCYKSGSASGIKSWHFEYCKDNPDALPRKTKNRSQKM
jgi:hypothetical protein